MNNHDRIRREPRAAAPATVRVMWTGADGIDKFASVRSYDLSESGMRLELPEAVEPRTSVLLQCTEMNLQGSASVRACHRVGMRYLVGLEFTGGLKWKPAPVFEPITT